MTTFARLSGCSDYLDVDPLDIDVLDIDPGNKEDWDSDRWVRAYRSGFMTWLHITFGDFGKGVAGLGAAMRFHVCRAAAAAAHDAAAEAEAAVPSVDDLDLARLDEWTDDQLARAWAGDLLLGLPDEVWDRLAEKYAAAGEGG